MNDRPVKVAIVGAGPSGFYAAESLLRSDVDVSVDMYEKLPVPFGLVRFGVAPDHPKLKSVTSVFNRIADMDGFRFLGNVEVGKDVSIAELDEHYHAIIFAYGAERGKTLGIHGEDLKGSYTAHEFVAWYNGHPGFADLPVDLSCETAAIIGQGNVALDVARILAKPVEELRQTDIADHALDVLAESRIRDIYVIGRRGPAQVQFAGKELREFGYLTDCASVIAKADLNLGPICRKELADPSRANAKSCIDILGTFSGTDDPAINEAQRRCHFLFNRMPVSLSGDGIVQSMALRRTELIGDALCQRAVGTTEEANLDCGLVVGSIGYKAIGLDGLPLTEQADRLHHENGRILNAAAAGARHYAVGWVKRGPQGTIGTNRGDSVATVETLMADVPSFAPKTLPLYTLHAALEERGTMITSFAQWRKIDIYEVERGEPWGRPRIKLTSVNAMLGNAGFLMTSDPERDLSQTSD